MSKPSEQTVYILENDAMPGLIKVGRTQNTVERRMAELYSTGVPLPFRCVHSVLVNDMVSVEGLMHTALWAYRENMSREFYRIPVEEAIATLDQIAAGQLVAPLTPPKRRARLRPYLKAWGVVAYMIVGAFMLELDGRFSSWVIYIMMLLGGGLASEMANERPEEEA